MQRIGRGGVNAAEQASTIELASKIAATVGLFKAELPDLKADLKPWANDPGVRNLIDPDSVDIGFHFPDTDPQYKGVDSKILLREVMQLLRREGYELGNIDATVCLEAPKVNPHILAMRTTMAKVMQVDESALSIKATTSEKMGFVGRKEGVATHAVALIVKKSN